MPVLAWSVGAHTPVKNEFFTPPLLTIGFRDGFHHAGHTRHIDLPHALQVENSGTNLVQDKGQMHESDGMKFLQQANQLEAGLFLAQIHADEANGTFALGWVNVNADDGEIVYLRQQACPQVPGHSGDYDYWFSAIHWFQFLGAGVSVLPCSLLASGFAGGFICGGGGAPAPGPAAGAAGGPK